MDIRGDKKGSFSKGKDMKMKNTMTSRKNAYKIYPLQRTLEAV